MTSLNTRWLSYAVLAGAVSLTMGATPQEQTAASRHIVLISLDGLPSVDLWCVMVQREVEAVAKRQCGTAAKRDGREIQDGERRHVST